MRSFPEGYDELYDELRLRIDRREQGSYYVHASTQSAEASATFELPFSEIEIENFILRVSRSRGRRRIHSSALSDAKRFGGALFQAVFREGVFGLYHDALAQARSGGRGLRITLCLSQAPELIDVPWEYLFDDPNFLAVSAFTPVVRYLDLPRAYRPLLVEPPLRLLGVVSSPAEYEQLDVQRERDNLTRALLGLIETGAIELHWLERPTLGELLRALQADTVHVLHYIGHAMFDRDADQGVLLFEDDSGWARPVSGEKLGIIVHDFSSLRLAVLNACEGARAARTDPFAGVAGSLVQRDIPAVIAMQFEITDEAAIVFAEGFYRAIAFGSPVDASLAAARLAMLAERNDDIEWGTPVLFMRVRDGRIFDLRKQPMQPPENPAGATVVVRRRLSSVLRQRIFTASQAGERAGSRSRDADAVPSGERGVHAAATAATSEAKPAGADEGGATARDPAAAPDRQPVREPPQRVAAPLRSLTKLRRKRAGATPAPGDREGYIGGRGALRRYWWPALGLLLVAIAAVVAIIVFISGSASTGQRASFSGLLGAVPRSRVTGTGTATVEMTGNRASVTVDTDGLIAAPHLMHIHGGTGRCPTASDARPHNGHLVIGPAEGNAVYGSVVTSLTTDHGSTSTAVDLTPSLYPADANIRYTRTVQLGPGVANMLKTRSAVIVVHGISYDRRPAYDDVLGRDGQFAGLPVEETAPALCGQLAATKTASVTGHPRAAVYMATLRLYGDLAAPQASIPSLLCHLPSAPVDPLRLSNELSPRAA